MLKRNIGLFLILFFAFILRVWGIGFGLLGLFHVDERLFPYNAFYAISHNFRIITILHGSFLPYLLSNNLGRLSDVGQLALSTVMGGIFWGLSMGVRYSLISFFIVPVLLYLLNPRKERKFILIFVAATFVTFFLVTPIFIFQFREFIDIVRKEIQIQTRGPWISSQGYPVWLYFLLYYWLYS